MSYHAKALGFVHVDGQFMSYDKFVDALFKQMTFQIDLFHAAGGVCKESGELLDLVNRIVVYENSFDTKMKEDGKTIHQHFIEELGDVRFYMQALMNMINVTETEILQYNAEKLGKRYPNLKYSNEAATARADKNDPFGQWQGRESTVVETTIKNVPVPGAVTMHEPDFVFKSNFEQVSGEPIVPVNPTSESDSSGD